MTAQLNTLTRPDTPQATSPSPITTKLRQLFGIDLRSLAALRIGTGLIVITDLLNRLPDLTAHYTDRGVLPRWALLEQFANPYNISLHLISGQAWAQAVLFLLAGIIAALMVVGYRTRLMTILSWAMLVSLHARNTMVLDSGDVLLRMLLFWSMFLPTGARWSVDAAMGRIERGTTPFVSVATLALLLQLFLMYFLSALFKSDPVWHNGQAIFQALQIDQFATPLGHWLLNFPTMLSVMTYVVWWLELVGPVLVFLPVFTVPVRIATVIAFWFLHLGMGLGLELGHFPYICGVAWLVVLPPTFWDMARAVPRFDRLVQCIQRLFGFSRRWLPRFYSGAPARPAALGPSMLNSTIAMLFLLFVVMWNLRSYNPRDYGAFFPNSMQWIAGVTWVDQQWNMFSPRPMVEDGWYVIPGKMLNGREVDLYTNGGPVKWEKPERVAQTYPNTRWRKYMMNLWIRDNSAHRLWYARYLTRCWNETHDGDEKMESFQIFYMQQNTTADGIRPEPQKVMLWQHFCFR